MRNRKERTAADTGPGSRAGGGPAAERDRAGRAGWKRSRQFSTTWKGAG